MNCMTQCTTMYSPLLHVFENFSYTISIYIPTCPSQKTLLFESPPAFIHAISSTAIPQYAPWSTNCPVETQPKHNLANSYNVVNPTYRLVQINFAMILY